MSVFGESVADTASLVQCVKCRKAFRVDSSSISASPSYLSAEALSSSRAEALRRKGKLGGATDAAAAGTILSSMGPSAQFAAAPAVPLASPWRPPPLPEARDLCRVSSLSTPLVPPLQWSTMLSAKVAAAPVLRVDTTALCMSADESSTRADNTVACGAPRLEHMHSAKPMHQVLKRHEETNGEMTEVATVRPRGGAALLVVDATQTGPYLSAPLLVRAFWDLQLTATIESGCDTPQCAACWRESIVHAQKAIDVLQDDVTASGALRKVGPPQLSLTYRDEDSGDDAVGAPSVSLMNEVATRALEELRDCESELAALCDEADELCRREADIEQEEERVAKETNSLHVLQQWVVDRKDCVMAERLALDREVEVLESQCPLREAFVIELPTNPNASYGRINGVRIGCWNAAAASSSSATQGGKGAAHTPSSSSSSTAASPPLGFTFDGRVFTTRDSARLINGEPCFPLAATEGAILAAEINAACGFLALALRTLSQRNQLTLKSCVIRMNGGSDVTIDVPIPNKKPPQFDSTDFYMVQRFFSWKTFGSALVAYCNGVREMVAYLEQAINSRLDMNRRLEAGIFPPYPMTADGTVGGYSVKHGSVSDETWGRAMRALLANVDWCLAAQTVLEDTQRAALRGSSTLAST